MLPEHLIYDELKRRRDEWQPEALELPLYYPEYRPPQPEAEEHNEENDERRGVIIIDISGGMDFPL